MLASLHVADECREMSFRGPGEGLESSRPQRRPMHVLMSRLEEVASP